METYLMIIIIVFYIFIVVSSVLWTIYTFKYKNTLNYYIFQYELKKSQRSFIHWVEVVAIAALGMALITNTISQIQIWIQKR